MRKVYLTVLCLALSIGAQSETFVLHPKRYPVGPKPSAIAAPDVNEDGWPEIFTADVGDMGSVRDERPANDKVSFLLAQGDLRYVAQPELQSGFAPYCIVVANIDALKAPDLVVTNFHAAPERGISVFRNIGKNLFETLEFTAYAEGLPYCRNRDDDDAPVFTRPGLTAAVVDYFNDDEYRDIIATGWASDVLVFLPGVPDGYFGKPQFITAVGGPRDVKAADFDKDGRLDLVTSLYSAGELAFWKGDGKGGFQQVECFPTRGGVPHRVAVADVNGDGNVDVVVSHCHARDAIELYYGEGGFQFSVSQEILLGKVRDVIEHEIRDIVVQDLNGDDRPDIAAACFASGEVAVFLNRSKDKLLPQAFEKEVYAFKGGRPRALCAADFNKDGAVDLGIALWDENDVGLLLGKAKR